MSTEEPPGRPLTRREALAAERARAAGQVPPEPTPTADAPTPAERAVETDTPAPPLAPIEAPTLPAPAEPAAASAAPAVEQLGDLPSHASTAAPAAVQTLEPEQSPESASPAPAAEAEEPKEPAAKRVLKTVLGALVIVVLCASLIVGVATIAIPALAGGTALTVQTSSMEPNYPPGTMVIIRPTPASEIKPGDVITYQLKSGEPEVVTHRVTQQLRTADGSYLFVTQGDNNPSPDPTPIQEVQLKGKLWYAVPWVGHLASALSGPWRVALIPLAVGALFAYAAWMFISSARDKRRQKTAGARA